MSRYSDHSAQHRYGLRWHVEEPDRPKSETHPGRLILEGIEGISNSRFRLSPNDADTTEPGVRCRMRHPTGLSRLTLSACNKAKTLSMARAGNPVTSAPKLRCNAMINHVLQHVGSLALLYQPKCIATKLKVVSPLVDAKRAMALYVDPALDVGNQIIHRGLPRFQSNIGYPNHGNATPTVGPIRPARSGLPDFGSHFPICTVVDKMPSRTMSHRWQATPSSS